MVVVCATGPQGSYSLLEGSGDGGGKVLECLLPPLPYPATPAGLWIRNHPHPRVAASPWPRKMLSCSDLVQEARKGLARTEEPLTRELLGDLSGLRP